jgi:proteasome lid subunit RPN8/RPN11
LNEEQGGFILKRTGKDEYVFVPVTNSISGTPGAVALYIADTTEFNNKVLLKTEDGWEVYASYHTHPIGMRAMPSSIDISMLFTSFPINFIYAPEKELNRFDYADYVQYGKRWACSNIS